MPRKRHKFEEIVTKLRQVDVLVSHIAHPIISSYEGVVPKTAN